MTIKDVEKLTGLTAKSIRYYEEKGLIQVERNKKNSYRSYSEENVMKLKWIKLYRYLEFSIDEIVDIFDSKEDAVKEMLNKKAESFEDKTLDITAKKDLCQSLSKDLKKGDSVLEEYEETVQFLSGDEMAEINETLKEMAIPSLTLTIIQTLIFSGPILWLFVNISREFYQSLWLNGIFAIFAAGYIALLWRDYIYKRRHYKKRVKEKNKKTVVAIPIMLLSIVLCIAAFVGVAILLNHIFAPTDYLFSQMNVHTEVLSIWMIMLPIMLGIMWVLKHIFHINTEYVEDNLFFFELPKKAKIVVIAIWAVLTYICFSNITYVTEDKIIRHTPFNPMGTEHSYSDVQKVEAKFGDKSFSLFEYNRKGNFYYVIHFKDKKVIFSAPSVNEKIKRYEENTYLELEEFDEKLMTFGIEKESDATYADHCDLDKEYVDRFLRIAGNRE